MFKLIHDESFAERVHDNQYLIVKVYDDQNQEVGQVKLEIGPATTAATHGATNEAPVHIKTSGKVSMVHTHE